MKYLFILAFIILPVSCNIVISHGDKHDTETRIYSYQEELNINTAQKHDGGIYFNKNVATGVRVAFMKSVVPNAEEAIVNYFLRLKNDGRDYNYKYSTSNQQTRAEEGNHIKNPDGSESLDVTGSYSYINPNGNHYIQDYTANTNGFRTKFAFGTKIPISFSGIKSPAPPAMSPPLKGIDSTLLCSLIGGGCRKK